MSSIILLCNSHRSSQLTAANRPVQPPTLRSYYEDLWIQNFKNSKVSYSVTTEELHVKNSNDEEEVRTP